MGSMIEGYKELFAYPSGNRIVERKKLLGACIVKYTVFENPYGDVIAEAEHYSSYVYIRGWADCYEEFRERIMPA